MQLTFNFSNWHIEASQGVLGRQYDNLAHSIVVVGELPDGYTWDMLVECRGNYNIIPLTVNATGASAALTADQLALTGYYDFQLRGTQNSIIHHTNTTQVFIPDTIVGPGTWPVLPTEFSEAEAAIKELNAHPPVPGENGYWMIWDLDTHAYVQSDLPIPGLTMQIGDTITGEPGTDALVKNVGTPTVPKLQFTIPRGDEGKAATIQVGEVTASDPGSEPQVKNSGTENAAVFDFVLPTGQTGPTGAAATIEVESTVTGEPGTQASVENVGTTGAAKLKFTIPRGNTGQNGVTPTLSAGDVETLEPDQPATASVTGEGPAYQINLGIPQGQTGKTGATPALEIGQVETLEPGEPATAEITGETPNLVLNMGIPQGQPGQDGVQINDEAVNTTEAWSSKKILDTLCPPFTETGNPITCNPVEDYPLDVTVTMEPIQAGTGDPSPENVRPITGWDEVTVNVRGKNLFNISKIEDNEYITNNGDGSMTVSPSADSNGVSDSKTLRELCEGITPGTYTLNAESTGSEKWVFTAVGGFWYYGTSKTLTNEMLDSFLYFYASGVETTATISNIQVELGSTPTPYEPYQPGTTSTLTLPETIYGGTVDVATGVVSKEWAFVEFDGTENWEMNSNSIVLYNAVSALANVNPGTGCCSHFPFAYAYNGDNIFISVSTIYLGTALSAKYTLESWKSYLATQYAAGTPVTVCYKLATPEPFQATGNQPIPAILGENTVYTDGNSLAVSGRQDLLYTLQNMQAQTQNLNRFIAEGGTQ